MFGSQAENCGSKSPYPFIKWEHNLTVASERMLRTTYIRYCCFRNVLPPYVPQTWSRIQSWPSSGGGELECEADLRKLSFGRVECAALGSRPRSCYRARFRRAGAPDRIACTHEGPRRAPGIPSLLCCFHFPLVNLATPASARRL